MISQLMVSVCMFCFSVNNHKRYTVPVVFQHPQGVRVRQQRRRDPRGLHRRRPTGRAKAKDPAPGLSGVRVPHDKVRVNTFNIDIVEGRGPRSLGRGCGSIAYLSLLLCLGFSVYGGQLSLGSGRKKRLYRISNTVLVCTGSRLSRASVQYPTQRNTTPTGSRK